MFRPSWILLSAGLAALLYYLTEIDRTSAVALDAVELGGQLALPLWAPPATLAVVLAAGLVLRRATRAPPGRPAGVAPTRDRAAPVPVSIAEGDWYAASRAQAESLPIHPVGEVRFDEGWDIPFSLRLRQTTMEQARRRLDAFVGFLHGIPTPHKARVTIESSPDITLAHHHLVNAHLKRRFPENAYYVMEHGGGVDIVFANPDPRWSSRSR